MTNNLSPWVPGKPTYAVLDRDDPDATIWRVEWSRYVPNLARIVDADVEHLYPDLPPQLIDKGMLHELTDKQRTTFEEREAARKEK